MIINSTETIGVGGSRRLRDESDEKFEKRMEMQGKVLDSIDDFVSSVKEKLEAGGNRKSRAELTGAVFEVLVGRQHKIELEQKHEELERTELEKELLDFFKLRAGKVMRRPDLIDLKEAEKGDKIEIVRVVEATTRELGKRKYLQLRDFSVDLEDFLNQLNMRDLETHGYKVLPNVYDLISVSEDLKTTIYLPADKDLTDKIAYTDADGFTNEEWDEFVEDILPKVELRNCAFSADETRLIVDTLEPLIW